MLLLRTLFSKKTPIGFDALEAIASVGKAEIPRKGISLVKMYLERAGAGLYQNLRYLYYIQEYPWFPYLTPEEIITSEVFYFYYIEVIYIARLE
jgi:hypothetical protein